MVDCRVDIGKKFKDLSKEQIEELHAGVEDQFNRAREKGLSPAAAAEHVKKMQNASFQKKSNERSLNFQRSKEAEAYITDQQFNGDTHKGLLSMIEPLSGIKGGGLTYVGKMGNIQGEIDGIAGEGMSMILSGLKGDVPLHKKGLHDREIYKMWHSEPHSAAPAAVQGYKTLKKTQDFMFEEMRGAGIEVEYRDNRVIKTIHPREALIQMGEEEWVALADRVFEATPTKTTKERDLMFRDIFHRRTEATHSIGSHPDRVGRLEASRKLNPKDADSHYEYNHKMTDGRSLLDSTIGEIHSNSNVIGSSRVFGTKYADNYKRLSKIAKGDMTSEAYMYPAERKAAIKDIEAKAKSGEITKKESKDQIEKLKSKPTRLTEGQAQTKLDKLEKTFKVATGERGRGDNWIAATGKTGGQVADIVFLPVSLPATLVDLSNMAAKAQSLNGTNYFSELYKTVASVTTATTTTQRRELAENLMMFCEQSLTAINHSRFGDVLPGQGPANFIERWHQKGMQYTGLPTQSQGARLLNAAGRNMNVGSYAKKKLKFADIPLETQRTMMKVGIEDAQWNNLKRVVEKLPDGSTGVNMEKIRSLDDKFFTEKGYSPAEQKRTLLRRYQNYLTYTAQEGSPTGKPSLMHHLLGDMNDPWVQLRKSFSKFKTFGFAIIETNAEILMSPSYSKASKAAALAQYIPTAFSIGIVAMAASNILRGKPLPDLSDPDTIKKGFLKSGMLGVFGDAVDPAGDLANMVVGPTAGLLFGAKDVVSPAIKGEVGTSVNKGVKYAIESAPLPLGLLKPIATETMLRFYEWAFSTETRSEKQKRFKWLFD